MKVIISDDRKPYRVIVTQEEVPEDIPCYLLCYKVQNSSMVLLDNN